MQENKKIFLLFGPTQAGKSTLVNKLCGDVCRTGVGDGESTTKSITIYNTVSQVFPNSKIIDVMGIHDSQLEISDEEIKERIKLKLLDENLPYINGIIVFESVANDSIGLRETLAKLGQIFGNFEKSCLVLFSKVDLLSNFTKSKKYLKLKEICEQKEVLHRMWTNLIDSDLLNLKIESLFQKISELKIYLVDEMRALIDRAEEEALILQKELTTKETIEKNEEFEEDEGCEEQEERRRKKIIPLYTNPNEIEQKTIEYQKANTTSYHEKVPFVATRNVNKTVKLEGQEAYNKAIELRTQTGMYEDIDEPYVDHETRRVPYQKAVTKERWKHGRGILRGVFAEKENYTDYVTDYRDESVTVEKTRKKQVEKRIDPFLIQASSLTKIISVPESYTDYKQEIRYNVPDINFCRDYVKGLTKEIEENYMETVTKIRKVKKIRVMSVTVDVVPYIEMMRKEAKNKIAEEILRKFKA